MVDSAVIKSSIVQEVPAGSTAVLPCSSNDFRHNFSFWLFGKNKVIGPGNHYDDRKYRYEVLSGKLHIDNITPAEAGYYKCISKNLDGAGIAIGEVEMIVTGSTFSAIDAVKLIAIVLSIIVLIGCAILYWRLRKHRNRYDGKGIVPVDDTEDDEGDEVYNPTTVTSKSQPVAGPSRGPSRNQSSEHIYGIDNQGLDTDFNSVFENIQIKSPNASLI